MSCTFVIRIFAGVFFFEFWGVSVYFVFLLSSASAGGEFTLLCLFISLNVGILSGFLQCLGPKLLVCHQLPADGMFNFLCCVCVFFFFDKV